MKSFILLGVLCLFTSAVPPVQSQFDFNTIAGLLKNYSPEQKAGFLVDFLVKPGLYDKIEPVFIAGYQLFHAEPTFRPDILSNMFQWILDEIPILLQNETFKNSFHIFVKEINKANISIVNMTNEYTAMSGIFAQMDWVDVIGKIALEIIEPWLLHHGVDQNMVKTIVPVIIKKGESLIKSSLPPLLPVFITEINKMSSHTNQITTMKPASTTGTLPTSNTTSIITILQNSSNYTMKQVLLYHYLIDNPIIFGKMENMLLAGLPLLTEQPTLRGDILPILLSWALDALPNFIKSPMFTNSFHVFVNRINRANITGLNETNEYEFMEGVFAQMDWIDLIDKIAIEFAIPLSTKLGINPAVSMELFPKLFDELADLLKKNGHDLIISVIMGLNKADIANLERVNYTSEFIKGLLQDLLILKIGPDVLSQPTWKAVISAVINVIPMTQKVAIVTGILTDNPEIFDKLQPVLLSAMPILSQLRNLNPEISKNIVPWALRHLPNFMDSKLFKDVINIVVSEINTVNTTLLNQTTEELFMDGFLDQFDIIRMGRRVLTQIVMPLSVQSGLKPEIATFMVPLLMQQLERMTKTDLLNTFKILISEMNHVNVTGLDINDPPTFVRGFMERLNVRPIVSGLLAQPTVKSFLVSTLIKSPQVIVDLGKTLLSSFNPTDVLSLPSDVALSSTLKCYDGFMNFIASLLSGQKWAVNMFDAYGKPPTGTLTGNLHFIGSFGECLAVKELPSSPGGRYCRATFRLSEALVNQTVGQVETFGVPISVTLGMCVVSDCGSVDIPTLFRLGNFLDITPVSVVCSGEKNNMAEDGPAVAITVISASIAGMVLLATFIHGITRCLSKKKSILGDANVFTNPSFTPENINNGAVKTLSEGNEAVIEAMKAVKRGNEERGIGRRIMESFSLLTNVQEVSSFTRNLDDISCLHGIRFLTVFWITVGNAYLFSAIWPGISDTSVISNQLAALDVLKRFTFQFVFSTTLATDTFLMISGFIITYRLLLSMVKDEKLKISGLLWFYVRRYIRLTPVYMIIMMSYAFMYTYIGDGPTWPNNIELAESCRHRWWYHILYVNNLVDIDGRTAFQQCMPWSWFNAVVMQLNIITPILIIFFLISHRLGFIIVMLLMTGGITATGIKEHRYGGDILSALSDHGDYWNNVFTAPWCRVSSYCIGILLAYLLFVRERVKLDVLVAVIGWILSILVGMFFIFVSYLKYMENAPEWTLPEQAAYESLSRPVWSVCIAWVIFSCHNYRGGIINTILSWRGFIPLSRLSYTIYLLNPVVIAVYVMSRRSLMYVDDLDMVFLIVSYLVVTIVGAFIFSVFFERPFISIVNRFSTKSETKFLSEKDD